ncbi:phage holin family protein [Polycladomyces subterraneus]|uniref:Phage holin family protein n=1 Tax=Polycladomyces subterraneus TaxID=1016997 RepID=A0ABT8IJA0_9BACL|nr:phage holin family protein [Polycladomyces subterraneus]MDN4592865.1 phage holin family protein [Polycladomyces subterraneus]
MTIVRHLIRFIVAAIVLMIVGALVPGFQVQGFWSAFLAAVVIAVIGWIIEALFGRDMSPYARGVIGFVVSAVVIYLTQFFVPGMRVTLLGALLGALVIGIIDLFVPTKARITSQPEK